MPKRKDSSTMSKEEKQYEDLRDELRIYQSEDLLEEANISVSDYPHLGSAKIAAAVRRWLNANDIEGIVVKQEKEDGVVTLRKTYARRLDWSPFKHKDPVAYVDIFIRIENGLRDDYVEENGHVWHVKDYLAGKTGTGVMVTMGKKILGYAYPTPSDAYSVAGIKERKEVFYPNKMRAACSVKSKRRYC